MDMPLILWVNLNTAETQSLLPAMFKKHCQVHQISGSELHPHTVVEVAPDLICFEYDYPDLSSLSVMMKTKQDHPSFPVLMFTEQHSEAMAVWAFRAGVWDYFVKPVGDRQIRNITESLKELCEKRRPRDASREVVTHHLQTLPNEVRFRGSESQQAVDIAPAIDYVQRHLGQKIIEQTVAEACQLSLFRFSRLFKAACGVTFQEYLLQQRVQEAQRLLKHPSAAISDVAYAVGFKDPSYFSRIFKQLSGQSPSAFRNKALKETTTTGSEHELSHQHDMPKVKVNQK